MYFANLEGNGGSCIVNCNFQQFSMTKAFALMTLISAERHETCRSSCLSFSKAQAPVLTLILLCSR